jgi:hypothetical protein
MPGGRRDEVRGPVLDRQRFPHAPIHLLKRYLADDQ